MQNEQRDTPATTTEARVERVSIKTPPFWKKDPRIWFLQIESQFALAGITTDSTKYHHVLSAIDTDILQQITDEVINPPPSEKYANIKEKLISVFSESQEKKTKKLLSDIELGERKPSELLTQMKSLAGTAVPHDLVKTLWLQRLPIHVQSILTTSDDTMEKLSIMADKIVDIERPSTYAIQKQTGTTNSTTEEILQNLIKEVKEIKIQLDNKPRSRSRSRKRDSKLCWYHEKYQDKAKHCVAPCSYKNPDTEN